MHQRCSRDAQVPCTMYHVGGHGAQGQARIQLKAMTREDSVDACCGCLFFFFLDGMHVNSLDMWIFN